MTRSAAVMAVAPRGRMVVVVTFVLFGLSGSAETVVVVKARSVVLRIAVSVAMPGVLFVGFRIDASSIVYCGMGRKTALVCVCPAQQ